MKPSKLIWSLLVVAAAAGAATAVWKIRASRRRPAPAPTESPAAKAAREFAAMEADLQAFPARLNQYLKADAARQEAQRADFLKAVAARRDQLNRLSRVNPERAVRYMLPLYRAEDFPPELRQEFERLVSLRAEVLDVRPLAPAPGATNAVYQVDVRLPGDTDPRSGFTWDGAWLDFRGRTVPMQVWLLGDTAVIEAGFLHLLTAAELRTVRGTCELANPDERICYETEQKIVGEPTAALSGGKLFFFRDTDAAESFGRKLMDLERHRAAP